MLLPQKATAGYYRSGFEPLSSRKCRVLSLG